MTEPIRPPESWATDRLLLRPVRIDDAPALFDAYMQDSEVSRYMIWRPHSNVEETKTFLDRCERSWAEGTAFPWVLELAGEPVGMVEIAIQEYGVPCGYVLARRAWGQGLMAEALKPIVEWALAQPTIYRVWATCDIENRQSARVLEKVGMSLEGVLRRYVLHPNVSNEPRDALLYARTK